MDAQTKNYMPCGSRACPAFFFPLSPKIVRPARGIFQNPLLRS